MPAPRNALARFIDRSGSMEPYNLSWRDRIAQSLMGDSRAPERERLVGGLIGSTGLGNARISLPDVLPGAGFVTQGVDASEHLARGNFPAAAVDIGMMAIPFGVGKALSKLGSSMNNQLPQWDRSLDKIIRLMEEHRARYPGAYPESEVARISNRADALALTTKELDRSSGGALTAAKKREARLAQYEAEADDVMDRLFSGDPAKEEMAARQIDQLIERVKPKTVSADLASVRVHPMGHSGSFADSTAEIKARRYRAGIDAYLDAKPPPRNRMNALSPFLAVPFAGQHFSEDR
jgi:hypothetical protein